jgi:hypothetical protein
MSSAIRDGKGRGYQAAVNSLQQLMVKAIRSAMAFFVNQVNAEAFAMYFSQAAANAAANECLAYIKNTSPTKDLIIDELDLDITAANTVYISKVTGTPGGTPTAVTPTNLNLGSAKAAEGEFYKDDAMSGLTDVGRLKNIYLEANTGRELTTGEAKIVLPKDQAVAIFVTTQQAQTLNGVIRFHYESSDSGQY